MIALRCLAILALLIALAGCARTVRDADPLEPPGPAKPPGTIVDGPPDAALDLSRVQLIVPGPEPRSAHGNHSPYTVLGEVYHVKPTADGYVSRGIASWYGTKFHGRLTSSGEPYDMFQLTAAHRTLPLPTFAEVRNLQNGRSIVVRINDRGPFHPDRVIDLSWAAAVKLGIEQAGTGPVEVRAITFDDPITEQIRPARFPVLLQVGAFSERERADRLARTLGDGGVAPVRTERAQTENGPIWRVQVGPLHELGKTLRLVEDVISLGFDRPRYVYP